jgi:hypothetical protein
VDIPIHENLQYLITSLSYHPAKLIKIRFSEDYGNKEIISPFILKDPTISLRKLEKKVKESVGLSVSEYNLLEDFICSKITELDTEETKQSGKPKEKRELTVNKYSKNRKIVLHEAIILDGEPTFLTIEKEHNVIFQPHIEEKTRVLYPPSPEEYIHEPYEFQSEDEINKFIELARRETNFSLYQKCESIVSKYIDQEPHIKKILAVDIVFTYSQDKSPTVHYLGIFGDNNSGKSSIGDVFEALAYRTLNTTDPSTANIYRSLGPVEPGQISLVLDEAERIDQSHEMMTILKTGYDYRKTVSKVNDFTRKSEKFFTFCQKVIIGERAPSPILAKGLNDRLLSDIVYYGTPEYDIKEILNTTKSSDAEYQNLYNEIQEFRKLLFIYRLIHFEDPIKNLDIDIQARKKELVKPYLQLFTNVSSEHDKQIFDEIQKTFDIFLKIKSDKKEFTLEAALVPIIVQLMEESFTRKIIFPEIWEKVKTTIPGHFDERRPNEYRTEDFGVIYRNTLTHTLQKLGIETKRRNTFVELIFHPKKIIKVANQYSIPVQTKFPASEGERSERSERSTGSQIANESLSSDKNREYATNIVSELNESGANTIKYDYIHSNIEGLKESVVGQLPPEPSQHTQHTPISTPSNTNTIGTNLYRIGNTDLWGCTNCNIKDDRWFMMKHPCRGLERN